ncbi:MAG: glycosyltransferase [Gammaproteobacteria bacterium]|nr:glycosyltransferase [Gammaproteobacteria bacterium]
MLDSECAVAVSVCVVAYNQEDYIEKCLASLVSQSTSFRFEIIVGEDCSTDRTKEVIERYVQKYPKLIRPIFHGQNIGPVENALAAYRAAKGRYICHMDGDDYALPGKLQKQYEILEENLDCVICSHDVVLVDEEGAKLRDSFRGCLPGRHDLFALLSQLPFFVHSSKMFRNDLHDEFWNKLHPNALDIEVHVCQAKKGDIYHVAEAFGAYRVATGVSLLKGKVNSELVRGTKRIFKALDDGSNNEKVKSLYAKAMFEYAYQSATLGDESGLKKYISDSVKIKRYSFLQNAFWFLSIVPSLVIFLSQRRMRLRGYS